MVTAIVPPPPPSGSARGQRTRGADPWPRDPSAPRPASGSAVGPAAEFLGYLGGLVTTLAALYLAADWWGALGGAGQVLTLLAGTSALGATAAVVGEEDDVARRLSTLLWWLTGATALATTYLLVDRVARLGDDAALLAVGLAGLGMAGHRWRQRGGVALHLCTYASLLVSTVGAAKVVTDAPELLAAGLWALGAAWVVVTVGGGVSEQRTGAALGAATALGAVQTVVADAPDVGLALALVTVAGLTGPAVVRRDVLLGGFASLGALVFGPQVVQRWLVDVVTGEIVALIAGITMLLACVASIVAARRADARDRGPRP